MRIAFCTTNKNRTQHLKQTLPRNLASNSRAVFVLLNYGSQDGLVDYIKTEHRSDINAGRLVLYSHFDNPKFRMSHAKNAAHRLGILEGADVLVNVDADNFTNSGFDGYIARQFERRGSKIFMSARMKKGMVRGINGRIALTRDAFLESGGYDEVMFDGGYSSEDKHLNLRLRNLGYRDVEISSFYLDGIRHNDKMRFAAHPHIAAIAGELDIRAKSITNNLSNNGSVGCGTVFRNFDMDTPIYIRPFATRIFGIGMHRTATTSLYEAWKFLGYNSLHWNPPEVARAIWREMNQPPYRSPTLERYYALCDLPIPLLYRKLDAAYPGSKFILTIRNEDKWLESVRRHLEKRNPDEDTFTNIIHEKLYGRRTFDRDVFLARYRSHNAEVLEYFADRPDDLLVMSMDEGAGWRELCGFLDMVIPAVPYPFVNGAA